MAKKRIAVFGGAFNPFTRHHFSIAQYLLTVGAADEVLVIPAVNHRFKDAKSMAPYKDRINMIKMVIPEQGDVRLLCIDPDKDLPQEDPSFGSTWNLMNKLSEMYPDCALRVVIGADNLKDFDKWYNSKELVSKYEFLVLSRGKSGYYQYPGMRATHLSFHSEGSSTDVRIAAVEGSTVGLEKHTFGAIAQYILKKRLYQEHPLVTGGPGLLPDGSNYDKEAYAKAANTVDIAIVRLNGESLEVLLINRKWNPHQGMWAIPGGFVDIAKAEGLDKAALRELEEETNVKGIPVRQLATYGDPDRDKRDRVISTVYYALLPQGGMDEQKLQAMDDAGSYQWRVLDEEMDISDIAFDHAKILMNLLGTLRELSKYTPLPFQLLPPQFTWKQAQEAYTALLGHPLLNIRRKLGHRYMIESVGERVKGMPNRPAGLFQYQGEKDGL